MMWYKELFWWLNFDHTIRYLFEILCGLPLAFRCGYLMLYSEKESPSSTREFLCSVWLSLIPTSDCLGPRFLFFQDSENSTIMPLQCMGPEILIKCKNPGYFKDSSGLPSTPLLFFSPPFLFPDPTFKDPMLDIFTYLP